jgi:hypothetical protein
VVDAIEAAIAAGAVVALRRRAQRQRTIAESWTAHGAREAIIRCGEAATALRIAQELDAAARELEAGERK